MTNQTILRVVHALALAASVLYLVLYWLTDRPGYLVVAGCLVVLQLARSAYIIRAAWRAAQKELRGAVELPEVDAAVRRHPAGKARTAQPGADRGQFWATLGTPDVLAVDRTRQELADYELVKQKLKGMR
jgi:hypothetical protein